MDRPAIMGGKPVRKEKIYYGGQWIDEDDIQMVINTLKSPLITCGPKVKELEGRLCEVTGAKHAVVCSNGTAALHCACIAAGIGSGDEVITTPITFAASSNCVLYCNAKPVFADINPETYNIDPASIRRLITKRTKAVIGVDFAGQVVQIDDIRRICDEYNLIFIEDGAHSIGSSYKGKMVGSLADMTTFSFHPVKTVTAGEGGAILTDDKDLYNSLSLARSHGITHDITVDEDAQSKGSWFYEQIMLGYNYRMTDFQAALLLSQLNKLDSFKNRRQEIVKKYNEAFADIPEIIIQKEIQESDTCRHLYIIKLNLDRLKCSRREFFDAMSAENIQCQVHYIPVYWFPYYRNLGYKRGLCPNAEKIYESIMSIPLYPKMTNQDVEDVIMAVRRLVSFYRK